MAKILVADDNSNIQKMVGLALKDHGIEVVAVGNGEAAVRKISDIHPDLVLADVFMPVRNGYEVCKYVKEDPALKHIPVILLVGAFDPLDEQEAQRVGADGVLKKPFVPPDPLISMVKSALVRAGVAHAGFTPVKPAAEVEPAAEVAAPPSGVPTLVAVPKAAAPEEEMPSFVDEVPVRPAALKIESGQQPVAFGSLLETEGAEADEEPAELKPVPAALRMERDWRSSKPEENEEGEEDTAAKGSWRRDAGGDEGSAEEDAGSDRDFRSRRQGTWTPTREKEDLTAAAEVEERVSSGFAERRDGPASPFAGEAWAAAIEAGSDSKTAVAEAEKPAMLAAEMETMVEHVAGPVVTEEVAATEVEHLAEPTAMEVAALPETEHTAGPMVTEEAAIPEIEHAPEPSPAVETLQPSATSSWFSTPPSPWEAEAQKASQLASTWDAVVAAPVSETTTQDVSFEPTHVPDEIEVVAGNGLGSEIPAAAVETVREEASQAVEQVEHEADISATSADIRETVHDTAAHLDMDAVVAKVLSRLNPGLLHDATREILRPIVEAVIREELNSRKS